MKSSVLILSCLFAGLLSFTTSAEVLSLKEVDTDKLTEECQKSTPKNDDGMNLVWWVPVEFWQATLMQDPTATGRDVKDMTDAMEGYITIGVIRSDISTFGAFRFHDEARTKKSLRVFWEDEQGKKVQLEWEDKPRAEINMIFGMMRPMLAAAMGQMGQNFHFYVLKNTDKEGNTIVDPHAKGKLILEMDKLGTDAGGTIEIACPLDSLMKPRTCENCKEKMHSTWNYCPYDGEELPKLDESEKIGED